MHAVWHSDGSVYSKALWVTLRRKGICWFRGSNTELPLWHLLPSEVTNESKSTCSWALSEHKAGWLDGPSDQLFLCGLCGQSTNSESLLVCSVCVCVCVSVFGCVGECV